MSTGGKFLLVVNSGLQDKLLNAHELLEKRINKYIIQKNPTYTEEDIAKLPNDGYLKIENSILPSLNVVEQTHNIFVNGTYKPYVATTYEYIKVHPYGTGTKFGQLLTFQPTQVGNYLNDMVLHIKISGLRAKDARDRVRYVAFPGHKLVENVQFVINNGSIIDEYNTDDYNNHYLYELNSVEKKRAWCKNVGQEIPKEGFLTSDPSFDMQREYRMVGNGFQTLKYSHDTLEMFIPLLFWCNDVKTAISSHVIPWGQMQIKIQLAEVTSIVGFADYGGGGDYHEPNIETCNLYINNLFVPDTIFQLYVKKFVFNLIRVHQRHKEQIREENNSSMGVLLNGLKYPLETMFVSFRPRENLGLSQYWYKNVKLIERTYKVPVVAKNLSSVITGNVISSDSTNSAILGGALSAVDDTYISYDFIITGGTGYNSSDIIQNRYIIDSYNGTTKKITVSPNWSGVNPDSTTTYELFTPQLAINTVSYYEEIPTIKTLSLKINDIEIWHEQPEAFFNSYVPYRFGGAMGIPEDLGTYCITFNLYPMHFQPTGSYNSSMGRELYLQFTSDIISKDYPVDLIVSARAINFLVVDKGYMTLKYIT